VGEFPSTHPSASNMAMEAFRRAARDAAERGHQGGYPNFHEGHYGFDHVAGTIFFPVGSGKWLDVPLAQLGNPDLNDFGARMQRTQDYAVRNGFVGGFPTFYHANRPEGVVCGTYLLPSDVAEWRDVLWTDLGSPALDDIWARFRAINDWAYQNGFLSGFPTFYYKDTSSGLVSGSILVRNGRAEWADVLLWRDPR
jgi:hypothetical protein